jgi:long-chain acyl-CoA synthetase
MALKPWRVAWRLRALDAASSPNAYPGWPHWRAVGVLRFLLVRFILIPALRIGYRIEVHGSENLRGRTEPCFIVSNHVAHLDWGYVLCAVPEVFRRKLMVGAASDDIFGSRFRGFWVRILGPAFPLSREARGMRESLEFAAGVVNKGKNVLIFPEGALTEMGPMQPFRPGIGWLAAKTGVDIVPLRIDFVRPGLRERRIFPHPRGSVRVTIGRPYRAALGATYAQITSALEDAVRNA